MSVPTIFLVGAALGTDAFSLAVGIGMSGIRKKYVILVSGMICIFHVLMPLIGLSLGTYLGRAVGDIASIIGAAVLIFIGMWGLFEVWGIKDKLPGYSRSKSGSGFKVTGGILGLLILSGSVSLDALSVGFGLGTFEVNLAFTVIVFGITAGLMTGGGFVFGSRIGNVLGGKAEFIGSVILILIGIKMIAG